MAFDFKTAKAIVQPYDGLADDMGAFLDTANLLKDMMAANLEPTAARLLKTRLTGRVRLGLPDGLATIDEIIQNVKPRCAGTTAPEISLLS